LRTGAFDQGRASGARPAATPGVGPFVSEAETKIAAIWTDILGLTNFGRDDDFFAVGGDSLATELLVMAIEHTFATRLSPEMIQHNTTIAGLAALVDGTRPAGGSGKLASNVAAFIGASGDQRPTTGTMAHVAPPRNGQRLRNRENLAWALEIARAFTPSVRESLAAADLLVASGMTGKADLLLRRIVREFDAQVRPVMTFLSRLIAVNARFRRTGIEQRVAKLGELAERLSSPGEESILWAPGRSQKLLVVFTTMYDDFWVSCPVLQCILEDCGANILYLKDPRRSLYLRGLSSFGDSFEALVDGIGRTARQTGARNIHIMGHSSGGYAGLLAASRLDAAAFLGFSIRTDLAPDSPMPGTRFAKGIDGEAAGLLLDLKSIVTDRGAPRRAVLYCGEGDTGDVAHAEHMADLPNFLVKKVANTKHETVLTLLADGEFERAVRRFLR